MTAEDKTVMRQIIGKAFLVSRDLNSSNCSGEEVKKRTITLITPLFAQHWGVVFEIYSNIDGICEKSEKLIEATKDEKTGVIKCRWRNWDAANKQQWKEAPGFDKVEYPLKDKRVPYSDEALENFVVDFNQRKKSYNVVWNNCHDFAVSVMAHFNIVKKCSWLPNWAIL